MLHIGKKADFNLIIYAILVLILIAVFAKVIIPPLMKILAPFLGTSVGQQAPAEQTALTDLHQQLQYVTKYCGIAEQTKQACKCNVSLAGLGTTKILLHALGSGFADYYEFNSQEQYPVMKDDGWVDLPNFAERLQRQKVDGELCFYYYPDTLLDRPYTADQQALGIVFFKNGNNIAWATNIVSGASYDEFPGTLAVMWDKATGRRCIWLPRPKSKIKQWFSSEDLYNPLPDCAQTPAQADESIIAFNTFVDAYLACVQANNTQPTICKQGTLSIHPDYTVKITGESSGQFYLVVGDKGRIVQQREVGFTLPLCAIVEDRGFLYDQHPDIYTLGAGPYTIVNLGQTAICLYKGEIAKLSQFGIAPPSITTFQQNFNGARTDEQYLQNYLNPEGSAAHSLEQQDSPTVLAEARKQNVDYFLIKAIIQQESHWNPNLVGYKLVNVNGRLVHVDAAGNPIADSELSTKGVPQSYGIMQIAEGTAAELGCPVLYKTDPTAGIACGVSYLKKLMQIVQDRKLDSYHVIAAYNGGPGALDSSTSCSGQTKWQCAQNPGYEQTREYVDVVLSNLNKLQQQSQQLQQQIGIV